MSINEIIRKLRRCGIEVRKTNGGHWCIYTPKGLVFTSATPSDCRAVKNLLADLRRRGVSL